MSIKQKEDNNFHTVNTEGKWIVVRKMPRPLVLFTGDTLEQANAFLVFYLTLPIERRRLLRAMLV